MAVYIVCGGTTYSDIKSLRFAPEYDPTLATLPICEFEAEIVTDDAPDDFMASAWAHLREDLGYENAANTLLAGYYEVREAEQVGRGVVRIRARSLLDYLDRRTLPAELFQNVSYTTFVRRLFLDPPVNDGEPQWFDEDNVPITLGSGVGYNEAVAGFCPRQTARERLQWFLQSDMLRCVQFGKLSENGLYITHSPDKSSSTFVNQQPTRFIPQEYTYKKPRLTQQGRATGCGIVTYSSFTYTETKGEDWTSSVIRQDWDLETEQWVDVPVYYRKHPYSFDDGTSGAGGGVQITGNTLMYYSRGIYESLAGTYFRRYEAEVDILQIKKDGIDDTYIWPGDRVWFCADMETIYTGVVKSVDFTFGNLARAKLKIVTDAEAITPAYVEMDYILAIGSWSNQSVVAKRIMAFPPSYIRYDAQNIRKIKNPPYYYLHDGQVTKIDPESAEETIYNNDGAGTTRTNNVYYRMGF